MRFLIINSDYPDFLKDVYARTPGLQSQPYAQQLRVRNETLFGVSDFYPRNLRQLGHEAEEVHINNMFLQKAWAREHGAKEYGWWPKPFSPRLRVWPWPAAWYYGILEAQIRHYRPDVLLNYCLDISPVFLKRVKSYARLLVGQYAASPLPDEWDWGVYDLMISSFPPTLDKFRRLGIATHLHRLGFESTVLDQLGPPKEDFAVTFVGSFQPVHRARTEWLERICREIEVHVWSPDLEYVDPRSPIRRMYQGSAWGLRMYQILRSSRLTLNHHGSIPPFANNMRLYEATGVGTCLVTDWKENLREMFEPGREVLAYRNTEECIGLIQHNLANDSERVAVAKAGQTRTQREHSYLQRMKELVEIVTPYLRASARPGSRQS